MRQQYHFRESTNGYFAWDVFRLLELSKDLEIIQVPIDQIKELDEEYWYGSDENIASCRSVLGHAKLIEETDLAYPIILCHEGRVMDGMHRVCKAVMKGREEISAVKFKTYIEPDYVDVQAKDLSY